MPEQTIDVMVDGGKASAGPPLGPALGPTGIPIGDVIGAINEKTKGFEGMKVPVKVVIDTDSKTFKISVGSPPVSQLIKKELNIEKGASKPGEETIADIKIEQVIKIAKMKQDSLAAKDLKAAVKSITGTCTSMGILAEGKHPRDTIRDIDEGKFDKEIREEKTELSEEELREIEEEKRKLAEEMVAKREEFERKAKEIAGQLKGKSEDEIRVRLEEEGIPKDVIDTVIVKPEEEEKKEEEKAEEEKKEEEKE